jgi:hypothetical protein
MTIHLQFAGFTQIVKDRRIYTKVIIWNIFFLLIQGICYLLSPFYHYYLPFWLRIPHSPIHLIIFLCSLLGANFFLFLIAFFAVKKDIPVGFLVYTTGLLMFTTFGQNLTTAYTYKKYSQEIEIYNFSQFPDSSKTFRHLASDADRELEYLKNVFACNVKLPLRVCIFSSYTQMQSITNIAGNVGAFYDPNKNMIFVSIDSWHQTFRHELVHYLQLQKALDTSFWMTLVTIGASEKLQSKRNK